MEIEEEALKVRGKAYHSTGITLDNCFGEFSNPEELCDDNLWYCSKCKDHVEAQKIMHIARLPSVVVLQLKRFKTRNKMHTSVEFPLEGLDLSSYCPHIDNDNDNGLLYDLYAVCNHHGAMTFGHYTAFGKVESADGLRESWCEFDDEYCSLVDPEQVSNATSSAYMLFYKRREPEDLRRLGNELNDEDLSNMPNARGIGRMKQSKMWDRLAMMMGGR
eukprot:TRINITY_DN2814_c0_g1_i1.p1 TRINITY_DN2814_c0_g1~~TRINITY_DN2814_c0_g1_i1.p1  ORF type:complete len:249 (+),score=89.40 TRINITY_DN2814_c0_g1_i1:96-749(+)